MWVGLKGLQPIVFLFFYLKAPLLGAKISIKSLSLHDDDPQEGKKKKGEILPQLRIIKKKKNYILDFPNGSRFVQK